MVGRYKRSKPLLWAIYLLAATAFLFFLLLDPTNVVLTYRAQKAAERFVRVLLIEKGKQSASVTPLAFEQAVAFMETHGAVVGIERSGVEAGSRSRIALGHQIPAIVRVRTIKNNLELRLILDRIGDEYSLSSIEVIAVY